MSQSPRSLNDWESVSSLLSREKHEPENPGWERGEGSDTRGHPGDHSRQFIPIPSQEPHLFFTGSYSPFPLVNLSRYSPSGWIVGGALTLWPVGSGTAPWPSNNDWTARTVWLSIPEKQQQQNGVSDFTLTSQTQCKASVAKTVGCAPMHILCYFHCSRTQGFWLKIWPHNKDHTSQLLSQLQNV